LDEFLHMKSASCEEEEEEEKELMAFAMLQ
jgi:hypothetical protein